MSIYVGLLGEFKRDCPAAASFSLSSRPVDYSGRDMMVTPFRLLIYQAYLCTQRSIKSRVAFSITVSDTPCFFSDSIKRAVDMPEYRSSSLRNLSLMSDFNNVLYSANLL